MNRILKINLLFIIVLASAITYAQNKTEMPQIEKPSLTITSDHEPFLLYIDDVQQNQESVMSIKVEGVPEGQHKLRVEINNEFRNVTGRTVEIKQTNNSYRVDKQRNMYGISSEKKEQKPEKVVPFAMPIQDNEHRPHKHHDGVERFNSRPDYHRPDKSQHQPHRKKDNSMEDENFGVVLENISSKTFEADKLAAAKQIVANNILNINQIKYICRLLEFEDSKLDFAKSAYSHCTEKDKYYQLNDVFQFENSKSELEQFVQQQQEKEKETDTNVPKK
jgi:hypothetical protein